MFEYKNKKYGLSTHGGDYFFYSQKMLDNKKPQIKLKAKSFAAAQKEVQKIIDENLRVKK